MAIVIIIKIQILRCRIYIYRATNELIPMYGFQIRLSQSSDRYISTVVYLIAINAYLIK